jgi:murein DD-endopeptidase MepM/ murein hydrolase activator NlpD
MTLVSASRRLQLSGFLACVAVLCAGLPGARPLGLGAAAGAVEDPIVIMPEAPVQGDTIAVIVRARAGSAVSVQFNASPVRVFALSDRTWRALRGTDPDTPSATYSVTVAITPPGGSPEALRRSVRIGPTQFAERHLSLPPGTASLITRKNSSIEWNALNPVLARRTPEALWHGPFQVPVTGTVESPYGDMGFYNGVREWWHQGIDFPEAAGVPVTASANGIVALARSLPLGGNTVVLDHGQGVLTEYLHFSAFLVHAGQRVGQGEPIGRIGATGLVTGPSLHWGLYVSGHWVNPLFWTTARPGLTD